MDVSAAIKPGQDGEKKMRYFAIITDKRDAEVGISGDTTLGPFGTYKEAQWAIDHELDAAEECWPGMKADLTARIRAV